jgi:hypothetical protein
MISFFVLGTPSDEIATANMFRAWKSPSYTVRIRLESVISSAKQNLFPQMLKNFSKMNGFMSQKGLNPLNREIGSPQDELEEVSLINEFF